MTTKDKIRFVIIRSIGNFLVLFAIFGVFATFGPSLYYEISYRIIQIRGINFSVGSNQFSISNSTSGDSQNKSNSSLGFAQVLSGEKEQVIIPSDTVFSVLIPKIGINSRIFPNIDASSSDAFLPVLKQGVAHAQGTFFPGQKGNIYLFAHSVDNFWNVGRYNAIFYLLKNLKAGDDIVVYYQNVRHNYVVKSMGITNPSNVSFIVNSQKEKEVLILQTCWPPGTTWQRLMVFAEPK